MKDLIEMKETMTSSNLAELLKYEKKEINKKIRDMFQAKIDTGVISSLVEYTGLNKGKVKEYNLPELESKMFVAKHDINYLEKITQYWIDKKPQTPKTYLEAMEAACMALRDKQVAEAIAKEKTIQLDESKEWFTIKRVAYANGLDWRELSWRKLKPIYPIKKVFDANFPSGVNAYHKSAWEAIYPTLELPYDDYDENTALTLNQVR